MPRDTRTGGVLERMVLPALERGGYTYKLRVNVGQRLGCGAHFVDIVAEKLGKKYLISLKWQQVAGTAEQKIPFEVICLAETLKGEEYEKGYVVLGGDGWRLREFYVGGGLTQFLKDVGKVDLITLERFVARANRGEL